MLVTGAAGLEVWCRRVTGGYAGVGIANMTESWRDGLAFCAIIHRFRPHLVEYHQLQPGQVKRNCELAFSVAEKHLGIPSLLDPQDMLESHQLDKLSILTYVSQFYHRFSKESPTPATRRSILEEPGSNTIKDKAGSKDDENNNSSSDLSSQQKYSTSDTDGYFSSLSPYSSSSSSGCYQLSIPSDKSEWKNVDKSPFSKFKVSSPNSVELSSSSLAGLTAGKPADTTITECLHKSSKSTNMSESLTTQWNARKPESDQTLADFTDRPSSGIPIFNYRQLPVISPTPSSSSSKASTANELMFATNTPNDSGLEQSSVMSLTSSPSSSRLSSVSPSSEKMNRNLPLNIPKACVQIVMPKKRTSPGLESPKETIIETLNNNRDTTPGIVTNKNHETTELITNKHATFKETLTKFNSLSHVSGKPKYKSHRFPASADKTVKLISQSSQTEDWTSPQTQLVSQLCQTEESHLNCGNQADHRKDPGQIQLSSGNKANHRPEAGHSHLRCGNQLNERPAPSHSHQSSGNQANHKHAQGHNNLSRGNQDSPRPDPGHRYKRSRRNPTMRQVISTNMFYSSVYSNQAGYNNYWSHGSKNLPNTPGVQSTLV